MVKNRFQTWPLTSLFLACTTSMVLGVSCSSILGLGDPSLDPTGAGGASSTQTSTSSSSSTGAGGKSDGSGGKGGDAGDAGTCVQTAATCTAVKSDCLAIQDNSAANDFTLRVEQITAAKPAVFSTGVSALTLSAWTGESFPACALSGIGSFSWLLELNTLSGVMTMGGGTPVSDPHEGYSFVNQMITVGATFSVAPVTSSVSISPDGKITATTIPKLYLPIYTDLTAQNLILVPLSQVMLTNTTLSADRNCIGTFNADGLSPANNCQADPVHGVYSFINGGRITGYIDLEEADSIIINIPALGLNDSLCVLLSQQSDVYGNNMMPNQCARDADNSILFPGDWCTATNSPGVPGCYTALQFDASIAANGVKLNSGDAGDD